MKLHHIVSVILLLPLNFLSGQVDQLKANNNISWITETTYSYQLENYDKMFFENRDNKHRSTTNIIKNDAYRMGYQYEHLLAKSLLNNMKEDQYGFLTMDGKKLDSQKAKNMLSSIDTVITFDPNTMKESTAIVANTLAPDAIVSYKIKQLWWYDDSKLKMKSTITHIAPMVNTYNNKGEASGTKALFWVEMKFDIDKEIDYNNKQIVWAAEHQGGIEFNKAKLIKGNTSETFIKQFIKYPQQGKTKVYNAKSRYKNESEEFDINQIDGILSGSVDTLITFNPETFKETIEVIENKAVDINSIQDYRIVQHIYYDDKEKKLSSKLISISPMIKRKTKKGAYYSPMYYIHF